MPNDQGGRLLNRLAPRGHLLSGVTETSGQGVVVFQGHRLVLREVFEGRQDV